MKKQKMKAEVVNVIRTDTTEGIGTKESPVRTIRRYWTLDGKLISEQDYMGGRCESYDLSLGDTNL